MNQIIDAIYDGGVLKPLVPLTLPNNTRVRISLDTGDDSSEPSDSDVLARQQAALAELRASLQNTAQHNNNDGWSVRRHDELLYGDSQ